MANVLYTGGENMVKRVAFRYAMGVRHPSRGERGHCRLHGDGREDGERAVCRARQRHFRAGEPSVAQPLSTLVWSGGEGPPRTMPQEHVRSLMTKSVFMLALAVFALMSAAQAQDDLISIGKRMTLRSEVLQEERSYWVYVPASYDDSAYPLQRYPVLYLLDGDAHFHSASGIVQFMSAGTNGNIQIPELIIVAIPNTNRTRDLTPSHATTWLDGNYAPYLEASGGGEKFLRFLQEELFAHIESRYRTLPYRVLVGHSFGGLFSAYALVEAPSAFDAHILIDPSLWWDERLLVRRVEEIGNRELRGAVYLSLANNPDVGLGDPEVMKQAGRDFVAALQSVSSSTFRSELGYFEGEDHGSVPLLSLYHGLLFAFDGYKLPTELLIQNPSAVSAHFDEISNRLGVRLVPPGRAINDLGYALLYQLEDVDKAIELFEMNVGNFPTSFRAHGSLGEAYLAKGERALAIAQFEKAIELNPQDSDASLRLRELTAQ